MSSDSFHHSPNTRTFCKWIPIFFLSGCNQIVFFYGDTSHWLAPKRLIRLPIIWCALAEQGITFELFNNFLTKFKMSIKIISKFLQIFLTEPPHQS